MTASKTDEFVRLKRPDERCAGRQPWTLVPARCRVMQQAVLAR